MCKVFNGTGRLLCSSTESLVCDPALNILVNTSRWFVRLITFVRDDKGPSLPLSVSINLYPM